MKKAKKGYSLYGVNLNITGENLDGLYDEPNLASVEYIGFANVSADKVSLDFSPFKSLKKLLIYSTEPYTIPREICYLPNLEEIVCSVKCLLPPEIGETPKLWNLMLHGDSVLNMPESIADAPLKTLTVNSGKSDPRPMPGWITSLPQLEQLYLDHCNFTNIDANINNMANLKSLCFWDSLSAVSDFPALDKLKSLKTLDITGGSLMRKRPPYSLLEKVLDSIKTLDTLTHLSIYDWKSRKKPYHLVINEKGRSIPDIFGRFPQLTFLNISGMDIDFLPPSIFELPSLYCLYIFGNNLSEDCLKKLHDSGFRKTLNDLSGNQGGIRAECQRVMQFYKIFEVRSRCSSLFRSFQS